MIQSQTILRVRDNSGGKFVKCFKIIKKGSFPVYGFIGDLLIVSIKSLRIKNRFLSKVRKGEVVYALLLKTKAFSNRISGIKFSSHENSVTLLTKKLKPFGSRIFSVTPRELRSTKFSRVISISLGFF